MTAMASDTKTQTPLQVAERLIAEYETTHPLRSALVELLDNFVRDFHAAQERERER